VISCYPPKKKIDYRLNGYSLVYGGEALKQALKQSQTGEFHQFGKIALQ
jgi:hypothetical protein